MSWDTSWAEEVGGGLSQILPPGILVPDSGFLPILQSYQRTAAPVLPKFHLTFFATQLMWKWLLAYQNESPQDESFHPCLTMKAVHKSHNEWYSYLPAMERTASTCYKPRPRPTQGIRTGTTRISYRSSRGSRSMETRCVQSPVSNFWDWGKMTKVGKSSPLAPQARVCTDLETLENSTQNFHKSNLLSFGNKKKSFCTYSLHIDMTTNQGFPLAASRSPWKTNSLCHTESLFSVALALCYPEELQADVGSEERLGPISATRIM